MNRLIARSKALTKTAVLLEEKHEKTRDAEGKCQSAKELISSLQISAYGLKNNGHNLSNWSMF